MEQLELLWPAGQKRIERDVRVRLAIAYQAARDAGFEVAAAQAGKPIDRVPWYARPERPRQGLTGAALEQAVRALALEFPDQVN